MRGFLIACALAALVPLATRTTAPARAQAAEVKWPSTFDGPEWQDEQLDAREVRFFGGFAGGIARRSVLLRQVLEPTRRLHPAAECYRGLGFEVRALPPAQDVQGALWGAFVAERGTTRLLVHERISDEFGGAWTDTSAWFWAALLGRTDAPWTAVTVAQPLDTAH
jgi:hypothetical protein